MAAPDARAGSYVGANTIPVPGSNPVTYTQTPYSGGFYVVPGPNNQPTPYPYAVGITQNLAGGDGGDSGGITASCTGAITASWNWVPAPGQTMATDPPPAHILVAESCWVEVTVVSPMATGSYDTGMGEQGTVNWVPNGNNTQTATHARLTLLPGGPTVTLPSVNPSAIAASPGDEASVRYSAAIQADSRAVTISCPVVDTNSDGGSRYREPALTGPIITNVRGLDGTLRGDTVLYNDIHGDQIAGNSQSFSYHANVAGNWSGTYHWFSSLTGYSDAGSFPSVPDFTVPVPYFTGGSPNPSNAGAVDHIFISMYDSGPGNAEATANYRMHFHDEWEPISWPADLGSPYKVMGPDPDMPSWPVYPWKMINPLSELTYPNPSLNVTYQEAGIESVDGGLDLGIEPVTLHFGISGNPTDKFTTTQVLAPSPPLKIGQETWAVYREVVSRTKGHLDHYQTHGYSGTGVWRHDVMQGNDLNLYQPYQSSNTLASDPPAGWNPPGY